MTPPRRLRRLDDEGLSLAETLVAMALASVLLLGLASMFAADLRGVTDVRDKATTNAEVRLAADVIGRRLRVATPVSSTAPAFLTTAPGEVSFTASVQDAAWLSSSGSQDPPLTTVTYRYDAARACLTETLAPASGPARTTCVLRGAPPGQAVFTYYTDASGSTTTSAPADVRSVGISLTSSATTSGRTAASTVTTRVTCPNTVPRA